MLRRVSGSEGETDHNSRTMRSVSEVTVLSQLPCTQTGIFASTKCRFSSRKLQVCTTNEGISATCECEETLMRLTRHGGHKTAEQLRLARY